MRKLWAACVLVLLVSAAAYPQGLNNNEVEFSGTIVSALDNGNGQGTLFVQIDTVDLRVIVNSSTLISSGEDALTMAELAAMVKPGTDVAVEVTGKFSSSGIVANAIRVSDEPGANEFRIQGHITSVGSSGISLLGITIGVVAGTEIKSGDAAVPLSTLTIGTPVLASGSISADGAWTAQSIKVVTKGNKKKGNLKFEGVVVSYDSGTGLLEVAVNGATGNVTKVYITGETVVSGDLVKDAYVMVIGTMTDLNVTAKEVRVIGPLEIKPDDKKLKIGETASFTVKLNEPAAADVAVTLSVDPSGVVTLSANSVTVAKGERTADFSVTASAVGTATIKAEMTGGSATALVVVGNVSENENERPAGETRVAFAPDHIKLGPNDARDVVLIIQPPPSTPQTLTFVSKEGLVTVTSDRTLGKGVANMKVSIQAGATTGKDLVSVEVGTAKAELVVEIEPKGNGKK